MIACKNENTKKPKKLANLPLEGKGDRLRWMRCMQSTDYTAALNCSAVIPPSAATSSVGFAASFSSSKH